MKFKMFCGVLLTLVLVRAARADNLTFNFSGTIFSEAFNGLVTTPTAFSGTVTFDATSTNGAFDPMNQGSYTSTGLAFGVHIDDFGFGVFDATSFVNIGVIPSVSSYTIVGSASGTPCVSAALCISIDFTGANVTTVDQPLSAPAFTFATIDFSDQENFEFQGTVDTLSTVRTSTVPEPASLPLLLATMFFMFAIRATSLRRFAMHQLLKRSALSLFAIVFMLMLSQAVFAVDGVVLINQASANAGGVNGSCDTPGFPVTICQPGSYKLSGNLTVANSTTTAILITTDNVSIDLNGFSILGPVNCSTDPCANRGEDDSGSGIATALINTPTLRMFNNITVANGTIQGMGGDAIFLLGDSLTVDNMHLRSNGLRGVDSPTGSIIVRRCTVQGNGNDGISLAGGLVIDNTVTGNRNIGIAGGNALVTRNVVIGNPFGLVLDISSAYSENVFRNTFGNTGGGLNLGHNSCNGVECP